MSSERTIDQRLTDLLHKEAIRDVLLRYCHGMDRRDPAVLDTVFWPGSPLEYGMFKGSGPEFAKFIVPWFHRMGMSTTMHLIGNSLIRVNGMEALAETYFQAFHCAPNEQGVKRDVFVAGRYHDEFQCQQGEWRISKRKLFFDWFRDFGDTGDWEKGTYDVSTQTAQIGSAYEEPWKDFKTLLLKGGYGRINSDLATDAYQHRGAK